MSDKGNWRQDAPLSLESGSLPGYDGSLSLDNWEMSDETLQVQPFEIV